MVKKVFSKIILITLCLLTCVTALLFTYLLLPSKNGISEEKLAKNKFSITFLNAEGNEILQSGASKKMVELANLPDYVANSFIAVEDKRFYKHNGIDVIGMARAFKNNLFSKSIKEGGSTITQQLIKNSHLSSEKTLARKIKEIKLALTLEKIHTKEEILSYYLNGIYFGEGCYGIESASENYFGKKAKDLTLVQACALASTVKAPAIYNPRKEKCEERKNTVLKLMLEQGYISETEYSNGVKEKITTLPTSKNEYLSACEEEGLALLNISPYLNCDIKIQTYYEENAQKSLNSTLNETFQGGIIMSKNGKIKGYKLSEGDFERPPASVIKPLLVYAPAIEEGLVHLSTKVLDEPCDFNGYTPENYGGKYYGWVSVQEAIERSLNIPAIKVLDGLGTKKARLYARKLGIDIKEDTLSIALGSYNGGVDLKDLCASYTVFLSQGNYFSPTFIKEIFVNGKSVYKDNIIPEKVFSAGTCEIINEALHSCTQCGTAKAIGELPFKVCAKTGTAGVKEKGNTDAYTLCYTSEDIIGVRFCNANNSLMPNGLTGGEVSKYAREILVDFYSDYTPCDFEPSNQVKRVELCSISYQNGVLALADKNQPSRYTFSSLILDKYAKSLPISSFSAPSLDYSVSVNNRNISIKIEKNEHVFYKIEGLVNNEYNCLYSGAEAEFIAKDLPDGVYKFKITPYVIDKNGQETYGEEIILPDIKINLESDFINSPWWEND